MLRDMFGQQIGPGDVVFRAEAMQLCVVTKLWSAKDADGWPMESIQVSWLSPDGRHTQTLSPRDVYRVTDYSDFAVEYRNAIVDLEELYTTITGERYG